MMLRPLALLAALSSWASASITFTTPAAGGSYVGGGSMSVQFANTGSQVYTTYTLSICAGGNTDGTWAALADIVTNTAFPSDGLAQGVISAAIGASTPANAYFLRIIATGTTGSATFFSSRFSMTGMTGTFSSTVLAGAESVTTTTGPDGTDDTAASASVNPGEPQFTIPFNDQIGLTRWAPMQSVPPTSITKKTKTPLYSASSITGYAKSPLPIPTIQTTITESQTFSVASRENTASPAAMPSDDMAKFLARWKD